MSASHPQAHIGLPAICTAKLVIIYLKTIIIIKNIAKSGIFQMLPREIVITGGRASRTTG